MDILGALRRDSNDPSEPRIEIARPMCEYRANPLGIQKPQPRLSWQIASEQRSVVQTAYQIQVADTQEKLAAGDANLWDSGKVASDKTAHIAYQGRELQSGMRCWWRVRIWTDGEEPSEYSDPAYWEMGLLEPGDWEGDWIGPGDEYRAGWAPMFRRQFTLHGPVRRARAYVTGLGYYELYINGQRIGDHVLDPIQTDYEERVFYLTWDVTEALSEGANAVGMLLGDGWYSQGRVWGGALVYGTPRALLQVNIEYEDGSTDSVVTDPNWTFDHSPIVLNNVYAGETYDARLAQPGWSEPEFDDGHWHAVQELPEPGGRLVGQDIEPIRKIETIQPVAVTEPQDAVYVYDMGQNFAGWVRLRAEGPPGTEIVLRFAEELSPDGMIDPESTGTEHTRVIQTDRYICAEDDVEIWEPRFTYHGFRYVEMTGYPGKPDLDTIDGIVVHADVKPTGSFECSDATISRIHSATLWTQRSNLHGIPEDCPARERCGWLGDAQVCAETTIYNWHMPAFWSKYLRDIETTRKLHGRWMMIAPGKRLCGEATPAWGSAQVQIPWYVYLYYADASILETHYAGMRDWVEHLLERSEGYIVPFGLGDWCPPGSVNPSDTPVPLTSTAYLYFDATIVSKAARLLGNAEDAERYERLAAEVREAFNGQFFDEAAATYGSQTADSFALYLGLAPEDKRQAIADSIARNIIDEYDGHLNVGIIGARYIFNALSEHGHGDVVQRVFEETTYPSYGFLFSLGATTMWESWAKDSLTVSTRSRNHPMHTGLNTWFYSHLAGIQPDEAAPGFAKIAIKPHIVGAITYVKAGYESIRGPIQSHWRIDDGKLRLDVAIPPNTSATVHIPNPSGGTVLEGRTPVEKADAVTVIAESDGEAVCEVGSGRYEFCSDWPE